MKLVTQQTKVERCSDCRGIIKRGDCATAVIASILGLDLDEVPRFVDAGSGMFFYVAEWLARRVPPGVAAAREDLPPDPVYAAGVSPRDPSVRHAVVWSGGPNGAVVWDPHPDRTGLAGDPLTFAVIARDPSACASCGQGEDATR